MLPIAHPERWERYISASHSIATRVEVWRGDALLVEDLLLTSGSVTRDLGSRVSATAKISVADPALLPLSQDDPLAPLGSSIRVYSGVRYPDGSVDMPQLFDGPIVSVPTWPGAAGSFDITAESWIRYVIDNRFLSPYAPPDGASALAELVALLEDSVPGAVVEVDPSVSDAAVAGGKVWEQERIDAVEALASMLGALVLDRPTGGFLIKKEPLPDPSAVPLRRYRYGEEGAVLEGSVPELVRSDRYNAVLAYNPDDPAVRHLATVSDPASPVRWGGPFGNKVRYFASPLLTAETVQQAAETRLSGVNGRMRTVGVSVLPDPSLEPGDHVSVSWPPPYSDPLGQPWSETLIVRSAEHPLGPGATKLGLRGTGAEAGDE